MDAFEPRVQEKHPHDATFRGIRTRTSNPSVGSGTNGGMSIGIPCEKIEGWTGHEIDLGRLADTLRSSPQYVVGENRRTFVLVHGLSVALHFTNSKMESENNKCGAICGVIQNKSPETSELGQYDSNHTTVELFTDWRSSYTKRNSAHAVSLSERISRTYITSVYSGQVEKSLMFVRHKYNSLKCCVTCGRRSRLKGKVRCLTDFNLDGSWAHPRLQTVNQKMHELFGILCRTFSNIIPYDVLLSFHHLNVSRYGTSNMQDVTYYQLLSEIESFRQFLLTRGQNGKLPCAGGGLLGGAKKNKKNTKGNQAKQNKNVSVPEGKLEQKEADAATCTKSAAEGKQLLSTNNNPRQGPDAARKEEPPLAPEGKLEQPEIEVGDTAVNNNTDVEQGPKPEAEGKQQQKNNKNPRKQRNARDSNPRNANRNAARANLVNRGMVEDIARDAGRRDAIREMENQRRDDERAEQARLQQEKEAADARTKAMITEIYELSPGTETFRARPVINVGIQAKCGFRSRMYVALSAFYGLIPRSLTIPAFYYSARTFVSNPVSGILMFQGSALLTLLAPTLFSAALAVCTSRPILNKKYSKLHHEVTILPETEGVSRRDLDGNIVDTRFSEIKIGEATIEQRSQNAIVAAPLVVSLLDEVNSPIREVITPQEHNAALTRNLVSEQFSWIPRSFGFVSTGLSDIGLTANFVLPGYHLNSLFSFASRVVDRIGNSWINQICGWLVPPGHSLIGLEDDTDNPQSFTIVDSEGKINLQLVSNMCHILSENKDVCGVVGSFDAKQVSDSLFDIEKEQIRPVAYKLAREVLPFCTHSYHNACSYGSLSSQISPETNYAMLYRKLSRYTAIAQDRFASKELVPNAEILARLKFWAVREAPLARVAASHF